MHADAMNPADPTRRALIAALAGGMALATPAAAGTKGKSKPKPKPPLAAALARIVTIDFLFEASFVVGFEYHAVDLRPDGDRQVEDVSSALVAGGTAEQMRASFAKEVGTEAGRQLGVEPGRVAVLVV